MTVLPLSSLVVDAEDWHPLNPYGTTGAAGTLTKKIPRYLLQGRAV